MNGHGEPGATPNMQGLFGRAVTRKCMELEDKLFGTKMSDLLSYRYQDFGNLVSSTDTSWNKRLVYSWQNITVLVPDPESQEWKDLRLTEEFEERGCNPQNSKKQCPQIRRFLEHHLVDSSLLIKEGKKRKTKAGNKTWWGHVGEYGYIYPPGVRIFKRVEVLNGEIVVIERPL